MRARNGGLAHSHDEKRELVDERALASTDRRATEKRTCVACLRQDIDTTVRERPGEKDRVSEREKKSPLKRRETTVVKVSPR